MKRFPLLALAAFLLALSGCGSSSSNSSSSSSSSSTSTTVSSNAAPAGGGVKVTIKNLAFVPASVNAKVGQTVQWVDEDAPPHNVTYLSGPKFTSSPRMSPGAKFQIKLTQAGTIHYVCTIHPFMKATIVVSK